MGNQKKSGKKSGGWQVQLLLIFAVLAAIVALSTTLLLVIGMLPTLVALFIDRTAQKTRGLTVGAMNAAGCAPFVLQLWMTGRSMDDALMIISDPRTIIVMYCAAGVGYIIDWSVSGLVGTVMVERGESRRKYIAKRQAELVERWGPEVSGDSPADPYGFSGGAKKAPEPEEQGAGKGKAD